MVIKFKKVDFLFSVQANIQSDADFLGRLLLNQVWKFAVAKTFC